jgi:hypothetical protein
LEWFLVPDFVSFDIFLHFHEPCDFRFRPSFSVVLLCPLPVCVLVCCIICIPFWQNLNIRIFLKDIVTDWVTV